MTDSQRPLIFKDFQKAVADSPHVGHALMRNVDIEIFPGSMRVKNRLLSQVIACVGQTFTADAPTDVCTAPGDLRTANEIAQGFSYLFAPVTFTTTGTLPAGLALNTVYFLIPVTNSTFKVSNTWGNANSGVWLNITDSGSGVHTIVPIVPGTINQIVNDKKITTRFSVDSNGRVWWQPAGQQLYLLPGNTLTATVGNGLSLFRVSDSSKLFLFSYRNAAIDVVEVTGSTQLGNPSWTNSWKSMNSGSGSSNVHYAIVGQDNITYFTDDRYIGSIVENAGSVFDPSSSGTYTYNNQALNLPLEEIAQTLEEAGTNLLIGGLTFNKIYPWDRISSSFTLPIAVPEVGIYRLLNSGGNIYVFAGTKGNIYVTQGTYAKLFKTIPGYITNGAAVVTNAPIAWGDAKIRTNGSIVFGMSSQVVANSGVYVLYPDGRIVQDNTPSAGGQLVPAIYAENDFYTIGYNGGYDVSDISRYAQGTFATVYQSQLVRVGNKTSLAAYHTIEVQCASPATTGQLRLSYRLNDTGSFTVLDTYTADSATTSFQTDIGLINLENIQIQAEFDGNMEPMEIRLFP